MRAKERDSLDQAITSLANLQMYNYRVVDEVKKLRNARAHINFILRMIAGRRPRS